MLAIEALNAFPPITRISSCPSLPITPKRTNNLMRMRRRDHPRIDQRIQPLDRNLRASEPQMIKAIQILRLGERCEKENGPEHDSRWITTVRYNDKGDCWNGIWSGSWRRWGPERGSQHLMSLILPSGALERAMESTTAVPHRGPAVVIPAQPCFHALEGWGRLLFCESASMCANAGRQGLGCGYLGLICIYW